MRPLNKKMIRFKGACKLFPGTTSKDFVRHVKLTLQESEVDIAILRMGVNDILNLGSSIDPVSKDIMSITN